MLKSCPSILHRSHGLPLCTIEKLFTQCPGYVSSALWSLSQLKRISQQRGRRHCLRPTVQGEAERCKTELGAGRSGRPTYMPDLKYMLRPVVRR